MTACEKRLRDLAFHDAYARFGGRHNQLRVLSCSSLEVWLASDISVISRAPCPPFQAANRESSTRDQDQFATVFRENPAEVTDPRCLPSETRSNSYPPGDGSLLSLAF